MSSLNIQNSIAEDSMGQMTVCNDVLPMLGSPVICTTANGMSSNTAPVAVTFNAKPSIVKSNPNPNINHNTPVSSSISIPISSQNVIAGKSINYSSKGNQSTSHNQSSVNNNDQILTMTRLQDLVRQIDPCEQLDEEVEEMLIQFVGDFVTRTVNSACLFAKHRNSNTVEVKDVQLHLERTHNMWFPGFGTVEVKPYKKPLTIEAHKQRLALIRKSLRKY